MFVDWRLPDSAESPRRGDDREDEECGEPPERQNPEDPAERLRHHVLLAVRFDGCYEAFGVMSRVARSNTAPADLQFTKPQLLKMLRDVIEIAVASHNTQTRPTQPSSNQTRDVI